MSNFVLIALITRLLSADAAVYINEVAPSGGGATCGQSDWVELYNDGSAEFDISGYRLCDRNGCSYIKAYTFPANSKIAANGYIVVCKKNGTQQDGFEFGIGTTDTVLFGDTGGNELSTTGKMKGRSDGYTYARLTSGSFDYVATATPALVNDQTLAPFACTTDMACWDLFDQNQLRSYNMEILPANIELMSSDIRAEVYVPCKLTVNYGTAQAEEYPDAGCRTKGSQGAFLFCDGLYIGSARKLTTGATALCRKLSVKVDANYFNKNSNVRFHGLKKLQFHSMNADRSLMFERLAYNLLQRANLFISRAMHAKVYVNGVTNGIHLSIEQIDDRFLDARLKDKVAANTTLYKDLWPQGCTSTKPAMTCPGGEWDDGRCSSCTCLGGVACDFAGCLAGSCYGGKEDARCLDKPANFDLRDGGACNDGIPQTKKFRWAPCVDESKPIEDCYIKARRDGTGHSKSLADAIKQESEDCVSNDCSSSQALAIVDKYFNKTALVDSYVATLFDMDQFTTLYSSFGHNFYTAVNNNFEDLADRVTMISWDFDRGMALCNVSLCPGGGYLGDVVHHGRAPLPEGNLELQRGVTDWGRCYMPPWFSDVTKVPELNTKYCVEGVTTFARHVHPACDTMINVHARALKGAYATRMLEVLNGAEAWAEQHVAAWRAQIRGDVIEDALNSGGHPTELLWDGSTDGTLQRAKDVFAWGRKLAAAAASADQNSNSAPTEAATKCFKDGINADNPLLSAATTTLNAFPNLAANAPPPEPVTVPTSTVAPTTTKQYVDSFSSTGATTLINYVSCLAYVFCLAMQSVS